MDRTAELRTYRDNPTGKALVGNQWIHFCAHGSLFGVVLWGRPNGEQIQALVRSLKVELQPAIAPHQSLVDCSRLEGADADAFAELGRYVSAHSEQLGKAVTRLALVRPGGMEGAVIAGFFQVTSSPYPVQVFDDVASALDWLGESPQLVDEIDRAARAATGTSMFVARLRALLSEHLGDAELSVTAQKLGVSERTLQRKLKGEETSFAAELLAAKLDEAQRRMRDTDTALSTIAFETGFSSQQHLSTAFKKAFGETPSSWRKRS